MPKQSIPDQFSDEEMEQMKRHGAAQLGGTDFSAEVEKELDKLQAAREASAGKMHAAQTGGGDQSLGPSDIDTAAIKQRAGVQEEANTQAAAQAQQAQGAQAPVNAPPAPSGPQGTTIPFSAQKGAVGGPGNAAAPSQPAPPSTPPPDGGEPDGSDPATQWPE